MFKLKEVIKDNEVIPMWKRNNFKNKNPYGIVLYKEFDSEKDTLSQLEMNEINSELKQRWLK